MKQAVKFTQYIVKIFKHLKKSTMASVIRKKINIRCHNKPFYWWLFEYLNTPSRFPLSPQNKIITIMHEACVGPQIPYTHLCFSRSFLKSSFSFSVSSSELELLSLMEGCRTRLEFDLDILGSYYKVGKKNY